VGLSPLSSRSASVRCVAFGTASKTAASMASKTSSSSIAPVSIAQHREQALERSRVALDRLPRLTDGGDGAHRHHAGVVG
jgi:hypothetical protein